MAYREIRDHEKNKILDTLQKVKICRATTSCREQGVGGLSVMTGEWASARRLAINEETIGVEIQMDVLGSLLACVQALYARVEELEFEIEKLQI